MSDVLEGWLRAMRVRDFERAWQLSDIALAARRDDHLPRHEQQIWNGAPLEGRRVLVRCYHGLGDTIQFARYLPLLKEVSREVVVWAQPALLDLLKTTETVPYLHVASAPVRSGEELNTGLCWQAGDWDAARSIEFEQLSRCCPVPACDFIVYSSTLRPVYSSISDSPWYPTMRLFRQDADCRWEPVISAVVAGLACYPARVPFGTGASGTASAGTMPSA